MLVDKAERIKLSSLLLCSNMTAQSRFSWVSAVKTFSIRNNIILLKFHILINRTISFVYSYLLILNLILGT